MYKPPKNPVPATHLLAAILLAALLPGLLVVAVWPRKTESDLRREQQRRAFKAAADSLAGRDAPPPPATGNAPHKEDIPVQEPGP